MVVLSLHTSEPSGDKAEYDFLVLQAHPCQRDSMQLHFSAVT